MIKALVFFLLFFSIAGICQKPSLKHFAKTTGLNNPFIYNINQDKRGFIWVGTGNGFYSFDGFHFTEKTNDKNSIKMVTASSKDREGNLWIGHDNGLVSLYNGADFRRLTSDTAFGSDIKAICHLKDYTLTFLQAGKFLLFDDKKNPIGLKDIAEYPTVLSALAINNHDIFIGTDAGLFLYRFDSNSLSLTEVMKFSGIPVSNVDVICKGNNDNFYIATKDEGFYSLYLNPANPASSIIQSIASQFQLELWNIDYLYVDRKNDLWVGTNDQGLYCFSWSNEKQKFDDYEKYDRSSGLTASSSIRSIFEDSFGNLWFGTFGEGIFGLFDNAIGFIDIKNYANHPEVNAISKGKKFIWLGVSSGLIQLNDHLEVSRFINLSKQLPENTISSLAEDAEGNLWIGTKKNGLFHFNVKENKLKSIPASDNSLENTINSIIVVNNVLWLSTNGGVVEYHYSDKSRNVFSTNTGLPHNKINSTFCDSQGTLWIATKSSSLVAINQNRHHQIGGNFNIEFTAITQDKEGVLWAATAGNGVFGFKKDTLINLSSEKGLFSDYCYSITIDRDGNLWVGHRKGMSKILNNGYKIIAYDEDVGIQGDCSNNALLSTTDKIVFGTTRGVVVFNIKKLNAQQKAPAPELLGIKISDVPVKYNDEILLPYGKYSFRFDFIGLNYSQPKSVRYQYKLDGWDIKWSELTNDNWANYPRLDDGKYTFLLKTYTADGYVSDKILKKTIEISRPFWKKLWFQLSVIILVLLIFYFIVVLRERQQREFQLYLQELLNDRTAEVVKQKQELEIKNKDIMDSINYARRIQSSMLPSEDKLSNVFSQCFIINYPRDIVSGDFYWFNQYNNKFIILCADSTGHGVPGAFMSLIGITLIKDICANNGDFSPAMLLDKLDVELQNTINQNQMEDKSSDGMDASLIEIDLLTYEVRLSSAMRPIIVYHDGECIHIEGSKSTIGSTPIMNIKKEFNESTIKLKKGDSIYLFTDGITDQFGGANNKKFRVNKLKALLNEIHNKPMIQQKDIIDETYKIWKGPHDQIDDVLIIGLRL